MALVLNDRVVETCTSPGTGAVTLLGAVTGFQTFLSGVGNGNECYYCIADQGGANWEVGLGTYASSGNTLTRTTPYAGSSATPVNFSSGTQNVFVTYPAEKKVILDASGNATALGTISSGTWAASTIAVSYGGTGVTTSTGTGSVVLSNSPALTTPNLGTPSALNLTNATALPLTTGVSGVLPIANGGTNLSSFTSGGVVYASSTSALTTGSALTFDGTNLGIGTNSPATFGKFAVTGTLGTASIGSSGAALNFSRADANYIQASDAAGYLVFSTAGNERMRIDSSGNVGIGTSSPTAKVHASGSAVGFKHTNGSVTVSLYSDGTNGLYEVNGACFVRSTNANPLIFGTNNTERMRIDSAGNLVLKTGSLQEVKTAIAASNIDLSTGNYFTKTISGTTTFTVSNVPTTGTAISFILDITNGGSATVNWWTGVKWAGGTAPTLTSSGRDVLGFFTYDGGTTWTGLVLGKDVK